MISPNNLAAMRSIAAYRGFSCSECKKTGLSAFAIIPWYDSYLCMKCAPRGDKLQFVKDVRRRWGVGR